MAGGSGGCWFASLFHSTSFICSPDNPFTSHVTTHGSFMCTKIGQEKFMSHCVHNIVYVQIYIYIYMIYNDVYKSRSIYMYIGYRLYVELSILIYHLWISLCIPHVFQYKFRPALPQCVQGLIATKVQMAWPRNQLLVVTSFYCREYFGMQGRPQQILDSQTLLYSTTDGSYSPYNCSIESRWKHSH